MVLDFNTAFTLLMNKYPKLYASRSMDESKLRILDQILNVIGNGYRNADEFAEDHSFNADDEARGWYKSYPEKYTSNQQLYWAKKGNDFLKGLYTQEEMNGMDVDKWAPHNDHEFRPYPNFSTRYSLIYRGAEALDITWLNAAKWYYSQMQEFMKTDRIHDLHGAAPRENETKKWETLINEYEKHFMRYKDNPVPNETFFETITREYGCEYTGCTASFIKARSEAMIRGYVKFIDETLVHIDSLISKFLQD